jgi:hypothetical protein
MPKRQNRSVQTLFAQPATPAMKPMAHAKNLSARKAKSRKTVNALIRLAVPEMRDLSMVAVSRSARPVKNSRTANVSSQTQVVEPKDSARCIGSKS